jgi:hypothetical protein
LRGPVNQVHAEGGPPLIRHAVDAQRGAHVLAHEAPQRVFKRRRPLHSARYKLHLICKRLKCTPDTCQACI